MQNTLLNITPCTRELKQCTTRTRSSVYSTLHTHTHTSPSETRYEGIRPILSGCVILISLFLRSTTKIHGAHQMPNGVKSRSFYLRDLGRRVHLAYFSKRPSGQPRVYARHKIARSIPAKSSRAHEEIGVER